MASVASKGIDVGISADLSDYRIRSEAEVYLLDMGEPVKIIDLARRMIEISGFRVKD